MSKHHHQSKAEQINNKASGAAPFHFEKVPYRVSELMEPEDIQTKAAVEDTAIDHAYHKKGGFAVENWIGAKWTLKSQEMKKDILIIITALLFMTTFWGCNMVKGAGKDIENAGGSIQKTANHND